MISADNTIKDLTEKYSSKFNVNNRKLRADHNWWKQTQELFESKTKRDEDENKLILGKRNIKFPYKQLILHGIIQKTKSGKSLYQQLLASIRIMLYTL